MYKAMKVIVFVILTVFSESISAQINIWEDSDCGKTVEMTPYLADDSCGIAVIVCPGGSYFWHDMKNEGSRVAEWLQANGISAFVLKYRTAGTPAFILRYRHIIRGNRYPDALNDLRQALKIVRSQAGNLGIDSDKVGAMGFSAGGHLAMSGAELLPKAERPSFVASIYPVITMTDSCVHKRSRRALLGENRKNDKELRHLLSLEHHVPADCPPVFLVNSTDDPTVHYHNSELLDSALSLKNIQHKYLQYKTGGHGFGVSDTRGTAESREWKYEFIRWIKTLYK